MKPIVKLTKEQQKIWKQWWHYRGVTIPANLLDCGVDAIITGVYWEYNNSLRLLLYNNSGANSTITNETMVTLKIIFFGNYNKPGSHYGNPIKPAIIKYLKDYKR